jgi:hypothetical protein
MWRDIFDSIDSAACELSSSDIWPDIWLIRESRMDVNTKLRTMISTGQIVTRITSASCGATNHGRAVNETH